MPKPLAIDLYAGLGGWSDGLLAEGYEVVGFDIERHEYGDKRYPAQLVLQDVLTLHGSQFKDAALIVASPPCQEFSYMAMPWSRAKKIESEYKSGALDVKRLTALFDACFRIQREASAAAGHYIPMVVENVRGAQKWVGRSRWNYGAFHLWGDVPALMPMLSKRAILKAGVVGGNATNFHRENCVGGRGAAQAEGLKSMQDGLGGYGGTFGWDNTSMRRGNSKSAGRKAVSAMIAKIPLPLSRYIASVFKPI